MRILFVCTGNLCRSPMAEGLLRDKLARRRVADVEVLSAGTWGVDGEAPTALARAVMADRGIDVAGQRAASLESGDVAVADLVVAMTTVHRREIEERSVEAADKVVLLNELHEMTSTGATPEARIASLRAQARPPYRRALDVDDPMGLPIGVYERCAEILDAGIERLVELVWPGSRSGDGS